MADVPTALDVFDRVLDDYEEATGDVAVNDATKKTIMMQLWPPALRKATRDTIMAAQKTMKSASSDYLHAIIVQRCEFDDAALEAALPNGRRRGRRAGLGRRRVPRAARHRPWNREGRRSRRSDWHRQPPERPARTDEPEAAPWRDARVGNI